MSEPREFLPFVFAGLEVARIGADLVTGKRKDPVDAAAAIVSSIARVIPVAELRAHLDDFDRKAIDLAADIAEEEKLAQVAKENQP